MKLPSLKVSLPMVFLAWCVLGVWIHGLVLLAYPAMWAVVGAVFLGLHVLLRSPASPEHHALPQADASESVELDTTPAAVVPRSGPHKVSASA